MADQRKYINSIRISNLSKSTTYTDLTELVKSFGPTKKIFLARDQQTGQSKGFAYVNYKFHDDAVNAIATLNGHECNNFILDVDWSRGNSAAERCDNISRCDDATAICISNLNESTTEIDIEELVKPFGPIQKLYFVKDGQTGQCKGFAYIYFKFHKDAAEAIARLAGHEYNNLILAADWSQGNGAEKHLDNASVSEQRDNTTAICISNLSKDTILIDFEELVKPFGPIQNFYLGKDKKTGQCKGFAFVHFEFRNDAAKAIAALNGHEYNNCILSVDWSKHDDTTAIRLSNLSKDTTGIDFEELVKPFGPIQKFYLGKDKKTGQCKGFAFVHFKFRNDAAKAIAALDGHEYNNFIINVDWAKPYGHWF